MRWPRIIANKWGVLVVLASVIFIAVGVLKLQTQDDIRQLYSAPKNLGNEQMQIAQLLNLPSPSQYFLLSAKTPEQLLQRDAEFKARLTPLLANKTLVGINAVSDWLPSRSAQEQSAALVAKAETAALKAVSASTGETLKLAEFAQFFEFGMHGFLLRPYLAPNFFGVIGGAHLARSRLAHHASE